MFLTSANSINLARFLPQSFYYFHAYAQLKKMGKADNVVISVPSGNFGNITAGLFAQEMGLPIKRFIAANNRNDIFFNYLRTGNFEPKASVCTIANAMDVGNPSNFARILDLYGHNHENICNHISGATYNDEEIAQGVKETWNESRYLLDPHGACGYLALKEQLHPDETGVFLETAHPAKFKDTIDNILGEDIAIPLPLQEFMKGKKDTVEMSKEFDDLKNFLLKDQLYISEEVFY
jgi:threonine synthase